MRCSTVPPRRQRGFTLMELVITLVVMGLLAAVGTSMIVDTFSTARMVDGNQASADAARYALERVAREIREVKFSGGAYSISSTLSPSATSMVFTRTISGTDVTVTISRVGGSSPYSLSLGYSSPAVSSTLAGGVTSFTLDFLDLTNNPTALASAVRFVVISLTVRGPTGGQTFTERTRVALRNAA